jgi:hypothetical protein
MKAWGWSLLLASGVLSAPAKVSVQLRRLGHADTDALLSNNLFSITLDGNL